MNVKASRKEKNITQRELARLCNVSVVTIQNWEAGIATPKEENLELLKKILGITRVV